jgi:methylmalonyl-CoA mutase
MLTPVGDVSPESAERAVADLLDQARREVTEDSAALIEGWPAVAASYTGDEQVVRVRDRELRTALTRESLSGSLIPRVALPRFTDHGELLRFLREENLPGYFPFTAGVFPFKREGEDPARMFAGEGDPFRTNRRFKLVSQGSPATRLSTAFDSVTLYGRDPGESPDVYGKVGTSGVSIATFEDMKALYDGFDLVAPATSVSMTINGPAPMILAFLNTAIDQQLAASGKEHGRPPSAAEGAGIRARALATVRGTVQADILKEDQGQNTCIFSTEFGLRMMADIQEWFIQHRVRNFYSVSMAGYHIAEAGANPISQLAFTLANGFTYVEAYLARGMKIDDFAPNLSFFFSNGMDPEYTVMGRVARRIWAIQDESMLYEQRKHDGTLPVIGVNTFRNPYGDEAAVASIPLARATEEEKKSQLERVRDFQARHAAETPDALEALKDAARSGANVFAVLMDAVRVCSLQQITEAFFEVGGQYRRNV